MVNYWNRHCSDDEWFMRWYNCLWIWCRFVCYFDSIRWWLSWHLNDPAVIFESLQVIRIITIISKCCWRATACRISVVLSRAGSSASFYGCYWWWPTWRGRTICVCFQAPIRWPLTQSPTWGRRVAFSMRKEAIGQIAALQIGRQRLEIRHFRGRCGRPRPRAAARFTPFDFCQLPGAFFSPFYRRFFIIIIIIIIFKISIPSLQTVTS